MTDETQTLDPGRGASGWHSKSDCRLGLLVVAAAEAGRFGEVLLFPRNGDYVFGRGQSEGADEQRVLLVRQRPGKVEACASFGSPYVSRNQLALRAEDDRLVVKNLGKCPLRDGRGQLVQEQTLREHDSFEIEDQLTFLCVSRPLDLPKLRHFPAKLWPSFGEPDAFGIVGESQATWELREHLAFLAERAAHVLILGASGSGKELAANAIHRLSARGNRKLVARNAATFPAGLIEAELFGNIANYPNAGTPERPGLVGEADGSTLFLDELAELPEELQTRLLRVLDCQGEYYRLGDSRPRRSNFRFIGATNRGLEALRHDLAARLKLRLTVPDLNERREDTPLIAQYLLRRIAAIDAPIGAEFFSDWTGSSGNPRVSPALMRALVRHEYSTHVRELEALLWRSLTTSREGRLDLTPEVQEACAGAAPRVDVQEITAEQVRAALEQAGGVQERAWRELGLANRYVLKRLLKKFGIRGGLTVSTEDVGRDKS